MNSSDNLFNKRRLYILLALLLSVGFSVSVFSSYFVSRQAIRQAIIEQELPLASNNIYMGIQKDLVRPVLVSSTMASDTFVRDWVLGGERDVPAMARYLREIRDRYGAFSSFFVSEQTRTYYTAQGVFKKVSRDEPRDIWYYRVRDLKDEPYEINVDYDMANRDAMTIFVNYRMHDFDGRFLGAIGLGLTIDAVHRLMNEYQDRYQRSIYFVNGQGKVMLGDDVRTPTNTDLNHKPGLKPLLPQILQNRGGGYEYQDAGHTRLLNVHHLPEMNWFLFVEKDEYEAMAGIRHALYLNLLGCGALTVLVMVLAHSVLSRYQRRVEDMATTDKLTGLFNRQAFAILSEKILAEHAREPRPMALMLLDIDHFKQINDQHGHAAGDQVLAQLADRVLQNVRKSDIAVRWGGEEFLVLLKNCELAEAQQLAEKLRQAIAQEVFAWQGQAVPLTISIGLSQYQNAELMDRAISRADASLYLAKSAGRNRVHVAPEEPVATAA